MKWNVPTLALANDFTFMVMFFICRILIFPLMFSAYARFKHITISQVVVSIPKKCIVGCLFILVIQCMWMRVIILASIKRLRSSQVKVDKIGMKKPVEVNSNHTEWERWAQNCFSELFVLFYFTNVHWSCLPTECCCTVQASMWLATLSSAVAGKCCSKK